jgi:FAD/FMN-containing dehydrogenase
VFGHIGDGNLHINLLKPNGMKEEDFVCHTSSVDEALFSLVQRHGGSISAEHGIGLLKKPYLKYSRSEHEIAALRAVKAALDPSNVLNPGKIF